ncbi:chromosome segregation ATPase [Rhizobium sp. SG_E_25_P2]|jgi:hypothetical protein|uniref:hypothetical protein n=1 Tax=Rhizobium sp. SG_E_25_P2 TaxID=2879942 RepID=UPI00247427AF|nr:hypothetical protein [Rhizobium sp. SG_E_25_P2]MDH6269652.1 chromosome segregation ATPase [Rhizobium sp. SG_E_25_P2]
MSSSTDNLVLEHLRAIRGKVERLADDMSEVKTRIGLLEYQVGGLTAQNAGLSGRLDRLDERLGRIEKRLDLVDV